MVRLLAVRLLAVKLAAAVAVSSVALGVLPAAAAPREFVNSEWDYRVSVPSECRTEEAPGTLVAICAPDFDATASATIPAAVAVLFEVDAERVAAADAAYTETEFRQEMPEAICGTSETDKVKLDAVTTMAEGSNRVFTATITCPEIKFLTLPERRADVRLVAASGVRYLIMARSLGSDADKARDARSRFLSSFAMITAAATAKP